MAKIETRKCSSCQHVFEASRLQCPSCRAWNNVRPGLDPKDDGTMLLSEAVDSSVELIQTGPWDPCFGERIDDKGKTSHGIPKSSVTLVGGKAGAGKSTLSLQFADSLCKKTKGEVLIVSVEEAAAQVKQRGVRLGLRNLNRIRLVRGNVELSEVLKKYKPIAIVIDSLPKLCPDMAAAVEFCKRLKDHITEMQIPAIVIDHINKDEDFAGLEALQHEVDATLIFTVYPDGLRELRTKKNRNGPDGVTAFFAMTEKGLVHKSREDIEAEDEELLDD